MTIGNSISDTMANAIKAKPIEEPIEKTLGAPIGNPIWANRGQQGPIREDGRL